MMATPSTASLDPALALSRLQTLQQDHPLSILKLSSQIFSSSLSSDADAATAGTKDPYTTTAGRTSDASSTSDGGENASPASLRADLAHYKDLFAKLHFSYLEQVTKEKYLRSIVGDPPLLVSHAENVALETQLAEVKASLKQKKEGVEALRREMESVGRDLVERWQWCAEQMGEMERLPPSVREREERVRRLRENVGKLEEEKGAEDSLSGDGMDLGLEETVERTKAGEEELRRVEKEIEALKSQMPGKTRECEGAERELEGLERRKNEVCRVAGEERRRREEGGRDRVEEAGRWWRNVEGCMVGMGLAEE